VTAAPATASDRMRWFGEAGHARFGTCGACHHDRDETGKRLYTVRVPGGRVFRCFDCWFKSRRRRRT
jgi:hypothetical protein